MAAAPWQQKEALEWALKQARKRRNDPNRYYASAFTIDQEDRVFQALESMLADLRALYPDVVRIDLAGLVGRTLPGEDHPVDRIYCTEGVWRWCAESTTSDQKVIPLESDGKVLVLK